MGKIKKMKDLYYIKIMHYCNEDEKYFTTAFFVYFDCNRNFYFQEKHNKKKRHAIFTSFPKFDPKTNFQQHFPKTNPC